MIGLPYAEESMMMC